VFPASDLLVERVAGTGSAHHLPVALQHEVGDQSPAADGAGRQPIPHQPHGMLGGNRGAVVADEGNPVAHGVVPQGVGPLPEPAPALVDVPVGAGDEAVEGTQTLDACESGRGGGPFGREAVPVADVVPASVLLVEALHGAHVGGAALEGQARVARRGGVVDEHEGEGEGQVGGGPSVRPSAPHAARDDGRAI